MTRTTGIIARTDRWIDGTLPGRLYATILRTLAPAPEPHAPIDGTDRAIAIMLGTLAAWVAWAVMRQMPPGLYSPTGFDIWFQADQPRALGALTDRLSPLHGRDNVHPLFSLILFPFAAALRHLGCSPLLAGQAIMLAAGFGSTALLFLVLRRMGLTRVSAAMGATAFISSATYLHWFGIVETVGLYGLVGHLSCC